jgi:hypothetical protein
MMGGDFRRFKRWKEEMGGRMGGVRRLLEGQGMRENYYIGGCVLCVF